MGEMYDAGKAWLDEVIPKVMTALGERCVKDVKNELSIPYPGPSEPNDPPHYRTKELLENVSYTAAEDTTTISSSCPSESKLPIWLEFGTKKMAARPYMGPVMLAAHKIVPEVVREVVK